MKFYSGFSLRDEEIFFEDYINHSDYTINGFSYGAIKAFEDVKERLKSSKRVDTLQLFSPAFFQTKNEKFKKLQLMAYKKSEENYLNNFIDSCFAPYNKKKINHYQATYEELEKLLNYKWDLNELKNLSRNGIKIEVYLGGKDRIIDVDRAREFFLNVATVTYIKDANHFLKID
jgi:hypothetical protein